MIYKVFSIILALIGAYLWYESRKLIFKKNYLYKSFSYLLFYSAVYVYFCDCLCVSNIEKKLDVFSSISATLAGFVFTGLAIILALIEFDHIKNLFKNDFLDNLFYRGYGSIILSICNIVIYMVAIQYNFVNRRILQINQYVLGASILLLIMMMFDFVFVIKQLKINLKRK